MSEVAAAAGVSISTVSHVINGTRFVAPETQRRVRDAIAELGYRNQAGDAVHVLTGVIGLVVSETSYAYFAEVVQGVEAAARERGYSLLVCRSGEDSALEQQAVHTLIAHRVDGILLFPTAEWTRSALQTLRARETPFVLLDRTSDVKCDQVAAENVTPSQALVEHLIDAGHRRIAMLKGRRQLSTTAERLAGYTRALELHGIEPDPELIVDGGSSSRGGRLAVRTLLKLAQPPTAMFSSNDAMTVGAILALRDSGMRIPGDMAVVAFDDFEWGDAFEPRITTAAQPAYAIGVRGARALIDRIADPFAPPHVVRLPVEIVHRASCGCARETSGT